MVGHPSEPGGEHHGQAGAVGHVVEGTDFVLQEVGIPVLLAPYAAHTVVGQRAAPHQVGAGVVVIGAIHYAPALLNDGAEQSFAKTVGGFAMGCVGEVALHDVCHHVGNAAGRLEGRKGERQLGIHDGKHGAQHLGRAQTDLDEALAARDDGIARALATGGGNGEHHAHLEGTLHGDVKAVEIPEVAVVAHAGGYGLGGVDDRTAAHGQQEVDVLAASQTDALIHLVVERIGLHAAQRDASQASLEKLVGQLPEQAAAHHVALPVDHQHAGGTIRPAQRTGLLLGAPPEYELGGAVETEMIHKFKSCNGFQVVPQNYAIITCSRRPGSQKKHGASGMTPGKGAVFQPTQTQKLQAQRLRKEYFSVILHPETRY